jgi:hypothetical protein
MKKVFYTFGLLSLVMILTSFTTPESKLNAVGQGSAGGNVRLDAVGQGSAGGNVRLDAVGQGSAGGNVRLD